MDARQLDRWAKRSTVVAVAVLALPAGVETARIVGGGDGAWRQGVLVAAPDDVARMMADGRKVIFVDVREPAEFDQYHIPNAISVPLRDLDSADPSLFAGADLVVPYCLKDFRGFEGARVLQGLGVANVGLVEGYGINAWKRADLPTAGDHPGEDDEAALRALVERIESANRSAPGGESTDPLSPDLDPPVRISPSVDPTSAAP